MGLFSHLHKSAFWSQFVLGMVAIFALPNVQANTESEANSVINQSISQVQQEVVQLCETEQAIFRAEPQPTRLSPLQAVFAQQKSAKLDCLSQALPPIRAGPTSI